MFIPNENIIFVLCKFWRVSKRKQKKNYLKGNNSYNPTYFYLVFFIESCNGAGSRETKTKTTGA